MALTGRLIGLTESPNRYLWTGGGLVGIESGDPKLDGTIHVGWIPSTRYFTIRFSGAGGIFAGAGISHFRERYYAGAEVAESN